MKPTFKWYCIDSTLFLALDHLCQSCWCISESFKEHGTLSSLCQQSHMIISTQNYIHIIVLKTVLKMLLSSSECYCFLCLLDPWKKMAYLWWSSRCRVDWEYEHSTRRQQEALSDERWDHSNVTANEPHLWAHGPGGGISSYGEKQLYADGIFYHSISCFTMLCSNLHIVEDGSLTVLSLYNY